MAMRRSIALPLAVVCAYAAGGLLFAQPVALGPRGGQQPRLLGEAPQEALVGQSEVTAPVATAAGAPTSLLVGVFLGLLVGLTGYAAPANAARGILEYLRPTAVDPEIMRTTDWDQAEINNLKTLKADAKKVYAKAKKVNDDAEAAAKALMKPNYARASTGAGYYKQYKMDLAYPIKGIPDRDDGTYDIGAWGRKPLGLGGRYSAIYTMTGGYTSEAEKKRVQEEFGSFIGKKTKYGNFYSASAPYKYTEAPRFREKIYGEYGSKAMDALNAAEKAAKK